MRRIRITAWLRVQIHHWRHASGEDVFVHTFCAGDVLLVGEDSPTDRCSTFFEILNLGFAEIPDFCWVWEPDDNHKCLTQKDLGPSRN